MKKIFFLLSLISTGLIAQEPLLHPEQQGSYGAAANSFLVAKGGTAGSEFKTAATLGLDMSNTNEAQTLSAGGTTSPTISLNAISGTGGGTVTLAGAGGITLGQSAGTITITQTSGTTYSGTAPINVSGSTISLANSGVTAGTYNNVTVAANGTVTSGSNTAYLTSESQVLSRTATTNTAALTGGSSVSVDDVFVREEFTPTSGTTVTTTAALPTDTEKIEVYRNGIKQNVGAGKGVVSINAGTKVITVTRAFAAGEIVEVRFPKQ